MSRLTFRIELGPSTTNVPSVPVQVRRANLSLVAEVLSHDALELSPGRYHVAARLPGGQDLESSVELTDQDQLVVLSPDVYSPHEWLAQRHFFVGGRARPVEGGEASEAAESAHAAFALEVDPDGALRAHGLGLELVLRVVDNRTWAKTPTGEVAFGSADHQSVEIFVTAGATTSALHTIVRRGGHHEACLTLLPARPHERVRVIVTLPQPGESPPRRLEVDPEAANQEAEVLVRYLDDFDGGASRLLARAMRAEDLLFSKMRDPIAAAIGAYALLRCESLSRLRDWTQNLCEWFDWLPDGAAIRGEHAARMGHHEEAVACFCLLEQRGVPLVRDGVTFAVDRLRTYARAAGWLDEPLRIAAERALEQLVTATSHLDLREPYTTLRLPFSGDEPTRSNQEARATRATKGALQPTMSKPAAPQSAQPVAAATLALGPSLTVTIPLRLSLTVGAPLPPASPPPVVARAPSRPREPEMRPELLAALRTLEDSEDRPYFDAQRDKSDRASYYDAVTMGDDPAANLERLSKLLETTHARKPKYNPKAEVYPWVDLRPGLVLHSIYSDAEMDPEETIAQDFEKEEALTQALRELRLREAGMTREALAHEASVLEDSFAFNCEHVVPQSWFGKREPMRGDLHHLFACEPRCNSFRSNTPFAQLTEERTMDHCGRSESGGFEPAAGKGAVARAVLYFLVRYPGEINATAREVEPERIETLLAWHEQFPPDEYERHRNQAIFDRQGNRNPFIDFPEWAARVDFVEALGA